MGMRATYIIEQHSGRARVDAGQRRTEIEREHHTILGVATEKTGTETDTERDVVVTRVVAGGGRGGRGRVAVDTVRGDGIDLFLLKLTWHAVAATLVRLAVTGAPSREALNVVSDTIRRCVSVQRRRGGRG